MDRKVSNSGFGVEGRIDTQMYNTQDLRDAAEDFDSLSKAEKLELTEQVEPEYEDTTYNVTTENLHQYFVDNLDPGQTGAASNVTTAWFSLGTGGSDPVSVTDNDLNNGVIYKETVTDVADNGTSLLASTFIASDEANGTTYDELGLWSGDPSNSGSDDVFLINHATFNSVTKDNTKTVTFDVTLTFSDT